MCWGGADAFLTSLSLSPLAFPVLQFFFVLRKRNRQITPLHLIHHSTMFPLWWIGTRVVPGGHASVPAMVNSSVHVLMYSYYFATGLGDSAGPLRALLSLKQHLTGMQLAQFVFLAVVTVVGLVEVHAGRCHLPLWMGYVRTHE